LKSRPPIADAIVIGGGPAGLSAALVLGRCGRNVVLIDEDKGRNRASDHLYNYLLRDGISPTALRSIGRRQVGRYGVRIVFTRAIGARRLRSGAFRVTLQNRRQLLARTLLLATGMCDDVPRIPGLAALYGKSVHHCPYCDAHPYSGQPVAVLGAPKAAIGMAITLLTWTRHITVCTNGVHLSPALRREATLQGIAWREEHIDDLEARRGRLHSIRFESGDALRCRALFFNTDQYQRSVLPRRLGCTFKPDGGIMTSDRQCSSVPGLYIAGDADRDVQFSIVAAAEGAIAAVAINRRLQDEEAAARHRRGSPAATPRLKRA